MEISVLPRFRPGRRSASTFLPTGRICQLTLHIQELITSATTLGALIGGLVAGMLSDFVGRKPVLAISDVIFIGGAIGQAVCHTVWSMVSAQLASHACCLNLGQLVDWMPFPHRTRCGPRVMHCAAIHPRIVPNATSRTDGGPERGDDHWWTGRGVWHRFVARSS